MIEPHEYVDAEVWDGIIESAGLMSRAVVALGLERGKPESAELPALRESIIAESVDDILAVPGIEVDTESFRLALWFVLGPIITVLSATDTPKEVTGLCMDAGAVFAEASRRIDAIREQTEALG